MEKLKNISGVCDFLEDLDELVYIADMETYELVYMNRHLRESLGYFTHEDYGEQKCYKILQGEDQPCVFCTNQRLQTEKIVSWTHVNPLLNKRFLIKDSLFFHGGHHYRIEIAIDVEREQREEHAYYYTRSDSILSECTKQIFSTLDPEESLEKVLTRLGKILKCDRTYVFERREEGFINTYEWCGERIQTYKEILQKIPEKELDWWIEELQENSTFTIVDLETIRTEHPVNYAVLKAQDISCLSLGAIQAEGKLLGFLGVDNPPAETMPVLPSVLKVLGYFLVLLLKRRDTLKRLNILSFSDPLTGALNRNAFKEQKKKFLQGSSIGVLYCDITGLKQINDLLGHEAGDQQIQKCCGALRETLDTPWIYRMGGDEFVAFFQDISEQQFFSYAEQLKEAVRQKNCLMNIGCAWTDKKPFCLEELISRADRSMYQNKKAYYAAIGREEGRVPKEPVQARRDKGDGGVSPIDIFLNSVQCDFKGFFQSVSQQNRTSYFYMGDMQRDIFLISDNMREDFGFSENLVPSLLTQWAQRISSEKEKEIYWENFSSMLREKRSIHDLRYQVTDFNGENVWIHCYGILKWNEDHTIPLFFSGRITRQDDEFLVDPVTNFYLVKTMDRKLEQARTEEQQLLAIGIGFHHITEINSARGRTYSEHMLQCIAEDMMKKFSGQMSFYRLEGMRCIALTEKKQETDAEALVQKFSDIIQYRYRVMGISVKRPCSFAMMEYPVHQMVPSEFLNTMLTLLRAVKRSPNQTFITYSEENTEKIKSLSDMELALSHDILHEMEHFRIVIQPVVSVETEKIRGGEVLLRWNYQGKDISPEVFVPILEKEGMISSVGRWVFVQTVRTCLLLQSYVPDFILSFNVSLHQLSDIRFAEFMKDMLCKYRLRGSSLIVEMTESCMDEQPEHLLKFMNSCANMGIRIALDDFGSGYSSMKMLLQYPSSIIKLDRSLLGEMTESENKFAFISSIVYACHRFGKYVCMEGVETEEQALQMKEAGCDLAQGYLYYQPMELPELYRVLSKL